MNTFGEKLAVKMSVCFAAAEEEKKGKKKRARSMYCGVCGNFKSRSTRARFQTCSHISCYDCVKIALHAELKLFSTTGVNKVQAACPVCFVPLDWQSVKPAIVLTEAEKERTIICPSIWQEGKTSREETTPPEVIAKVIDSFFPCGFPTKVVYGWENHAFSDCLITLFAMKPLPIIPLSETCNEEIRETKRKAIYIGCHHPDLFEDWRNQILKERETNTFLPISTSDEEDDEVMKIETCQSAVFQTPETSSYETPLGDDEF